MRSLSARLLILTVFFVMLAEVFIFVPSVAKFRIDWLSARMNAAYLAMMAVEAAPDRAVGELLKAQLLSQVGAHNVLVLRNGARLGLGDGFDQEVQESFNLPLQGPWTKVLDALAVYFRTDNRVIRVSSFAPRDSSVEIELIIDEAPLRADMLGFGWRIFLLSVVISLFTASLVYLSLHWLLVRPMRRITDSMNAFSENPQDARRIIQPTGRFDEIGTAEAQLAAMQSGLRAALNQKARLAALGAAVAKINHDLRGALSSALVVSDRLEVSEDPEVQKLAPTVIASIERAVTLCSQILEYAGPGQRQPRRQRFELHPLIEEVKPLFETTGDSRSFIDNRVAADFPLNADRDRIFRVLQNLCRNSREAGASKVTIASRQVEDRAEIDIADDGPGLPPRAMEKLFQPFEGSARAGGTGLGLAIARELAEDNGGGLSLVSSGAQGTVFRLTLPLDTIDHSPVRKYP